MESIHHPPPPPKHCRQHKYPETHIGDRRRHIGIFRPPIPDERKFRRAERTQRCGESEGAKDKAQEPPESLPTEAITGFLRAKWTDRCNRTGQANSHQGRLPSPACGRTAEHLPLSQAMVDAVFRSTMGRTEPVASGRFAQAIGRSTARMPRFGRTYRASGLRPSFRRRRCHQTSMRRRRRRTAGTS